MSANAIDMNIPPPSTTESGDRDWSPKKYISYRGRRGIRILGV